MLRHLIRQTFTVRIQTHITRERTTTLKKSFKTKIISVMSPFYNALQTPMFSFVNIINIKPTDNEHLRTTSVVFAYRNGKKKI